MNSTVPNNTADQWLQEPFYPMDIHTAASIGNGEKVQDIIEKSAISSVIDSLNVDGWTPLMYAACCGDHQVVNYLLKRGANPNISCKRDLTPLILATKCGDVESVTLLINSGANINHKDYSGWTVLFYATSFGYRSVVQTLLASGATINLYDERLEMTPLMLAAASGHELIVKDLLHFGADLTLFSRNGATAISLALENGHTKVKSIIDAHLFHKYNYNHFKSKNGSPFQPITVSGILEVLGISKYYPIFENYRIDLERFFKLTDEDLKSMGINLIGPRKKITSAISRWHQNHHLTGNAYKQTYENQL